MYVRFLDETGFMIYNFYLRLPLERPLLPPLELLLLLLLLLPIEPLDEEELLLGVEKVELLVVELLLEGVE